MGIGRPSQHRILAVVRHPVGGVRTHILYTYPILLQAGFHFTFVVPEYEYHDTFCSEVRAWEGTEVVRVPHRDRNHEKPRFWSTVRKLLKRRQFSLIHSHGVQAAVPTVFANLGVGLPHVMTSQDVFCRVDLHGIAGRLKLAALARILQQLDILIAVSEDTRCDHLQHLPELKKGRCQVKVIHNGIDLQQYSSSQKTALSDLRDRLTLDKHVPLLGFLGRYMPQKGFLVLADALTTLVRR
ncbi:MAG TPA: glycosyltransferase family 4 protein, partial [Pirellulales bacterium]